MKSFSNQAFGDKLMLTDKKQILDDAKPHLLTFLFQDEPMPEPTLIYILILSISVDNFKQFDASAFPRIQVNLFECQN